jgi:hypothetical protein
VYTEWHVLIFFVGVLVGFGVVFQGWFKQTSIVGFVAWGAAQIATAIKNKEATEAAQRMVSLAVALHLVEGAYWFLWGAVASSFFTFALGSTLVYVSAYRHSRRRKLPDAVATAGSRVMYFLVHGVKPYLAQFSMGASDARESFRTKRLNFYELLLLHLRRLVVSSKMSEREFRDACELLGASMLTLLFEPTGAMSDFRLAVFRCTPDAKQFKPIITVNRGDWRAHSPEPLQRDGSFLGSALQAGEPLVYPRDKKGQKFQKRGKSRWESFLVMPVPCDPAVERWGAVTVDHAGGDSIFTQERVEAVRDFSRFVEMLYALTTSKEDVHEPDSRAP